MIHYRPFRNPDPPRAGRGVERQPRRAAVVPRAHGDAAGVLHLRQAVLRPRRPDPGARRRQPVGFAHAGFGPDAGRTALDRRTGVVCALGVVPSHRRRGVGSASCCAGPRSTSRRRRRRSLAGPQAAGQPVHVRPVRRLRLAGVPGRRRAAAAVLRAARLPARPHGCGVFQRSLTQAVRRRPTRGSPGLREQYDIVGRRGTAGGLVARVRAGAGRGGRVPLAGQGQGAGRGAVRAVGHGDVRADWGETCVGMVELRVEPELRRQGLAQVPARAGAAAPARAAVPPVRGVADLDDAAGAGAAERAGVPAGGDRARATARGER